MATPQSVASFAEQLLNVTFKSFNKPIVIHELKGSNDGQGGVIVTTVVFATVDALIFPMKGSEKINMGRLITDQLFTVHLKPITGLTTKMKLVYNGHDYQIRSIVNLVESDSWFKLIVEKGKAL